MGDGSRSGQLVAKREKWSVTVFSGELGVWSVSGLASLCLATPRVNIPIQHSLFRCLIA